ncbi:MAG: tetratricopeptide repeat protein, partial [Cyanobacteria bacterium J06642_3]
QAIDYYRQSLEIAQKIDHQSGQANILCNLGAALIRLEKYPEAWSNLQAALQICLDTNNYYLAANTMQNIAAVCLKIGEQDLALQFCDRGCEASRQTQRTLRVIALWL